MYFLRRALRARLKKCTTILTPCTVTKLAYHISMDIFFFLSWPLFLFAGFILLASIKQVNQYERGIKFMFGKMHSILEPGWRIVVPIFQSYEKVDMRLKAVDVPDQSAITRDNVPVHVNAVLYYRINNAEKAILEVQDYKYAISQFAQTTLRNVAGEVTLDELLANRDQTAARISEIISTEANVWGLSVGNVELKDITLPADMERTIAKQAEAERERRAVIITSQGEVAAAENLAKAAGILAASTGALHLRTLQSINDISSDKSNTVVFAMPLEVLKAFEGFAQK
jgi:regulator of protease activity HflC (stomatin/prohibitin superfamily)